MADDTAIDQEVDAAETTIWDVASTLWGTPNWGTRSSGVRRTCPRHSNSTASPSVNAAPVASTPPGSFGISEHEPQRA